MKNLFNKVVQHYGHYFKIVYIFEILRYLREILKPNLSFNLKFFSFLIISFFSAISFSVVLLLIIIIFCCIYSRVKLAVALIEESSK